MCAFLIPHRSTNTAILSLQGMQFQGTRWGRLWTQPWGDQLLREGTRWLSPRWRGKSSSLSVLVVNKLEVLYQPLRALHHDESECYKVLIIKTCLCVCVFSKALVVVPVWNHDGTTGGKDAEWVQHWGEWQLQGVGNRDVRWRMQGGGVHGISNWKLSIELSNVAVQIGVWQAGI